MSPAAEPSPGLAIGLCAACGHAVFPLRALCPRCGGSEWGVETVHRGEVREVTEHAARTRGDSAAAGPGEAERVPVAMVRVEGGPVVVARSPDRAPPGAEVRLQTDSGAPVARLPGAG